MSVGQALIPPPAVIRVRLAHNAREARILRDLLRLAVRALEDGHELDEMARKPVIRSRAAGRMVAT